MLEGASDLQISRKLVMEAKEAMEAAEAMEEGEAREEYQSCIKIRGRPILPPVMTPEVRRECRAWKEKAILKEEQLRHRRRIRALETEQHNLEPVRSRLEYPNVFFSASCPDIVQLDLSESEDSTSELTDSDLEPKSFAEIHRLMKEQRCSDVDSVRSSKLSNYSTLSTPSTPLYYDSQVYSDTEPEPEEVRVDLYDSLLSLNTVIENPASRLSNRSDCDDLRYLDLKDGSDKENDETVSETFRPRRGSYTLDKPSPLLQAHLERFGSDEGIPLHDMSNHQRTPSPYRSEGRTKVLTSKVANRRLVNLTEKQTVLEQYLASLAEKPVHMSLKPPKVGLQRNSSTGSRGLQEQNSVERSSSCSSRNFQEQNTVQTPHISSQVFIEQSGKVL